MFNKQTALMKLSTLLMNKDNIVIQLSKDILNKFKKEGFYSVSENLVVVRDQDKNKFLNDKEFSFNDSLLEKLSYFLSESIYYRENFYEALNLLKCYFESDTDDMHGILPPINISDEDLEKIKNLGLNGNLVAIGSKDGLKIIDPNSEDYSEEVLNHLSSFFKQAMDLKNNKD